ncbi:membrane protein [Oleiphilus messinensis]|uniref:Membrane protein n=2 Tax=Oleiphilus messinensis TaxID=141451 RepID=A0A1Y0I1Y5_9GAMM|nr:membrane protein [Oleiphilus messinensis]
MHFTIAFTIAWLLTGDIVVGGAIALIEPAVNSVGYLFHEKFWERLRSGGFDGFMNTLTENAALYLWR